MYFNVDGLKTHDNLLVVYSNRGARSDYDLIKQAAENNTSN